MAPRDGKKVLTNINIPALLLFDVPVAIRWPAHVCRVVKGPFTSIEVACRPSVTRTEVNHVIRDAYKPRRPTVRARALIAGALAIGVVALCAVPALADNDDEDGDGGGHWKHRHHHHRDYDPASGYYYYYGPPQVVIVQPPPPPPVYYYAPPPPPPPPSELNIVIPLNF